MASPYRAPDAPLRDPGPEPPGPLPDLAAMVIGLALAKFLTMILAEPVVTMAGLFIGVDFEEEMDHALWIDLLLSAGFEVFAFWYAWRLSRSRALRVPVIVGLASLAVTFADRWWLEPSSWPRWYEVGLLAGTLGAVIVVLGIVRLDARS